MSEDTTPRADVTLDLRGLSCPGAAPRREEDLIDDMTAGQVLLLLSDCPGTPDDLFAWIKYTDNHIVQTERRPDGGHGLLHPQGARAARWSRTRRSICAAPCARARSSKRRSS